MNDGWLAIPFEIFTLPFREAVISAELDYYFVNSFWVLGCRLFYFGNSKNSVQQKLVQHIFQTENISQLIIGPGEQDASSKRL